LLAPAAPSSISRWHLKRPSHGARQREDGEPALAGESEGQFQPGALWADEAAESSGAFVLTIRPPGDRLIQATHEPTNISQTLATDLNPNGIGYERLDGFVPRSLDYSLSVAFWEQAAPSVCKSI